MARIYWDTMLFIYWLEAHPEFGPRVQKLLLQMERRGDQLCTGTIAVGEVLAGVRAEATPIRDFFRGSAIDVLPFTLTAAERYADIRKRFRVAPADGIHLATAADSGTDLFLTQDRRLWSLTVPGIAFIAGLDTPLL